MNERSLSNLEKQGLVQTFEFTHELSWKVLKDFLEYRGSTDLYGSRDVVRKAFSMGLLTCKRDNMEKLLEVIASSPCKTTSFYRWNTIKCTNWNKKSLNSTYGYIDEKEKKLWIITPNSFLKKDLKNHGP